MTRRRSRRTGQQGSQREAHAGTPLRQHRGDLDPARSLDVEPNRPETDESTAQTVVARQERSMVAQGAADSTARALRRFRAANPSR